MSRLSATLVPLLLATCATAHDHGGGDASMGQLLSYLHFAPTGDLLWFGGWAPRRTGPMVGVCIGLFMLAIFERWLGAARALAERSWSREARVTLKRNMEVQEKQLPTTAPIASTSSTSSHPDSPPSLIKRSSSTTSSPQLSNLPSLPTKISAKFGGSSSTKITLPFFLGTELSRGVIHGTQTLLGFAFMLAMMTFQGGFVLAIILGGGVGECLFGRFAIGV